MVAIWVLISYRDDVFDLDRLLDLQGGWYLGEHESGILGLADRELRVLGWYRARRYVDFRNFVPVSTELENEHQPCSGSYDDFCGYLRCYLPRDSRRSGLVGFLAVALSKFKLVDVATVPQSTVVGRVRGWHVRFDFVGVLV